MVASFRSGRGSGFSLIELLVTLILLSTLAMLVVPVVQIQMQRSKEVELRRALYEIRQAIDKYHIASTTGRIKRSAASNDYPKSLTELTEGVEDQQHPQKRRVYFLRRVPRNPFHTDGQVPPEATWALRSYASDPTNPRPGEDVYDVFCPSDGVGLNGVPYSQW